MDEATDADNRKLPCKIYNELPVVGFVSLRISGDHVHVFVPKGSIHAIEPVSSTT